jgi:nucleoid DNA-binding protein
MARGQGPQNGSTRQDTDHSAPPLTGLTVSKADIAHEVARATGLTRAQARASVDAFIASIRNALHRGDRVELRGFGVFKGMLRAPRAARNPRTGAEVSVPGSRSTTFKPLGDLRRMPLHPQQ